MRLIGLLVTVAVLGYTAYIYLGSSSTTSVDGANVKPAETIDKARQSIDSLNEVLKKQKQQLDDTR